MIDDQSAKSTKHFHRERFAIYVMLFDQVMRIVFGNQIMICGMAVLILSPTVIVGITHQYVRSWRL